MARATEPKDAKEALAFLRGRGPAERKTLAALEAWAGAAAPSADAWNELCALLAPFPEAAHAALVAWLGERLEAWPADLRLMPEAWWTGKATAKAKPGALARLARVREVLGVSGWTRGRPEETGHATFTAWAAPGGDVHLEATTMEPHKGGGKLQLCADDAPTVALFNGGPYGQVMGAAFARDGRKLFSAFAGSGLLVDAWETTTGNQIWTRTLGREGTPYHDALATLAVDERARRVAIHHRTLAAVTVLSADGGAPAFELPFPGELRALALDADGRFVAAAAATGALTIADVDAAKILDGATLPAAALAIDSPGPGLFRCVTARGVREIEVRGETIVEKPAGAGAWSEPQGDDWDEAAMHPELGAVLGRVDTRGRARFHLGARDQARALQGWYIDIRPTPEQREWLLVGVAPRPKGARGSPGAVYRFSPDGEWERPAGQLKLTVSRFDADFREFDGLHDMIDSWAPLELIAWAIDSRKVDVNERWGGAELEYPVLEALQGCTDSYKNHGRFYAIADLLLARGADPRVTDKTGRTALHALFRRLRLDFDNPEIDEPEKLDDLAARLIDAGCDPWARATDFFDGREEKTPARAIARLGLPRANAAINDLRPALLLEAADRAQWALVDQLLARGLAIDGRDVDGRTALHAAAERKAPDRVRELLKRGADPDLAVDERGETLAGFHPLHIAAQQGHGETVRALLDGGAPVDARTPAGWTAVHLATEWGRTEALQVLVEKGADIAARTGDGRAPVDLVPDEGGLPAYPRTSEDNAIAFARQQAKAWLAKLSAAGGDERRALLGGALARGGWQAFLAEAQGGKLEFVKPDLRGAELNRGKFADLVLDGALVQEMAAEDTRWKKCTLSFRGRCTLWGAELIDCTLSDWNAAESHLVRTKFERCRLRDLDLSKADASGATFKGCTLEKVKLRQGVNGLTFSKCELTSCEIGARYSLESAFRSCVLRDCTFTSETFEKCDFRWCTLYGIDFSAVEFERCKFDGARFDAACRFPTGFVPEKQGMTPIAPTPKKAAPAKKAAPTRKGR